MTGLEGPAVGLGDAGSIASKAESLTSSQPLPARLPEHSAVLKLKGLPYSATEDAILQFFAGFAVEKVSFVMEPDNRPSGLAFAEFATKEECLKALTKNGDYIGERYVRLLHVPKSEMEEQVRLGTLAIPGAAAKLRSRIMRNAQAPPPLDSLHGGMHGLPGFYGQASGMATYGLAPGPGGGGGHMFLPPGMINGGNRMGGSTGGGGLFTGGGSGLDGQRAPGWPNAGFQQPQGFPNQNSYGQPSQMPLLPDYGQQLPTYGQHNQGYGGQQVQGSSMQQAQQQQANYNNSPAALAAQFGNLSMSGSRAGTKAASSGTTDIYTPGSQYSRLGGGAQFQDVSNSGLVNLGSGLGGGNALRGGGPFTMGLGSSSVGSGLVQAVGGVGGAAATSGVIGTNPLSVSTSGTIKIRGLPYRSSPQDILAFFQNYSFLGDSLQIGLDSLGRPSGEAWLTFTDPLEAARAVKELNRHYLGNRYLELSVC